MDEATLHKIKSIAEGAGEIVLNFYHDDHALEIMNKSDKSPVTTADIQSNHFIQAGLSQLDSVFPIISEESEIPSFETRSQWEYYWLVDPLDGTKEFIHRTDEFSICIALIYQQRPILGVVYGPVEGVCYYACEGVGAFVQYGEDKPKPITVSPKVRSPLPVAISRRHYSDKMFNYLDAFGEVDLRRVGSALKFGLVADGSVDCYPCFGRTCEWDSAAGQSIIEVAGGSVMDLQGQPLRYNTKASIFNSPFIATCDPNYNWLRYLETN